jgi:hypothetical protein
MSLAERLREAVESLSGAALTEWKKTPEGYSVRTSIGVATLAKVKKKWVLRVGEHEVELPRRASFDHAERILVKMGAR